MATILVTGSAGQIGSAVVDTLAALGHEPRGFDLREADDLRDEQAVLAAAQGCEAIVHSGAIPHDAVGRPADIMATNVLGTTHVLLAAEAVGARRVVYLSSAQVFGFAGGEGIPERLPVQDDDRRRAARPYGVSKCLGEDLCAAWTTRTGLVTVALRPVMVLTDATLPQMREDRAELGAFVHVDDVVDAIVRSLTVALTGHHRMTLCGPGPFDTSRAEQVLGWQATRAWPSRSTSAVDRVRRGWRRRRW